ncbi:hypothetical protein SAMN05421876_10974 [Kaistella jeonii]|nr:hypothetical protein SAMN05421876_10974 [Kaistella jeonii]VEI96965.1 Uncharacterised protein [Kaistella jeonii]
MDIFREIIFEIAFEIICNTNDQGGINRIKFPSKKVNMGNVCVLEKPCQGL